MNFKTTLLCLLLILLVACSRNTKLPDDVNPIELTIVDSLDSEEIGSIIRMNIIDDKLYLVERGQHKFMILDTETLEIVDSLGSQGQGPLEFKNPSSILELNNSILIYDQGNSRFQVLDSDYKLQNTFKSPLIWSAKKINDTIYASTPGMLPNPKIYSLDERGKTTDIISLEPIFDELKLKSFDKYYQFFVENDELLITINFKNKLYKVDSDGKYEELENPFSKMKNNSIRGIQSFRKGFLVSSSYVVKENIFKEDVHFQGHLLYYVNNELSQIYEIPQPINFGFIENWVTDNEFIYIFDGFSSILYKLKVNN